MLDKHNLLGFTAKNAKMNLCSQKRLGLILLTAVILLSAVNPAAALEIIKGKPIQGGMMLIKTKPGHKITLNGSSLMVSHNGDAVIGFHRDDTAPITLTSFDDDDPVASLTITPEKRRYEEQRIDGLPPKLVTPPEDVLARIKRDRDVVAAARARETALTAFLGDFDWPTRGIITGVYGSRRILNDQPRAPHYGIDIAAPTGTEVRAPQAGIIRMVDDLYYTGWTIILDHGHGVSSTLLHLDTTLVDPGAAIEKGQVIGTVGSTGRSTGPHLDWRINWFDKRLDPALLAGPMPKS
jgi:murein DD-endopeptidase MepM/ murein hydrolase activator NlpD